MDLFLCLTPALNVGYRLDSVLKLRKPSFGSVSLILTTLFTGFGLFSVAWSWHSLLAVGKGHPQGALGVALVPTTAGLVFTGPFKHTHNSLVPGYLIAVAGVGFAWRSTRASLISPDGRHRDSLLSRGLPGTMSEESVGGSISVRGDMYCF